MKREDVCLQRWLWCVTAGFLACTDRADYVGLNAEREAPSEEQAEQGELLPSPTDSPEEPPPMEQSTLVQIPEASFVPGPSPVAPEMPATSSLPEIVALTAPPGVTNGGTILLVVELNKPQAEPLFVVSVAGDTGYHTVRGADSNGDGKYELEIEVRADVQASSLRVAVAPTDGKGNVGTYREVTLRVIPSGVGDVKVTLTFPPEHDLDLHVFEPNGFEVSYLQPSSASGGRLDLDSGSNCIPSVASAENIFWPPGAAPVGEYRVVVHEFEQCESGAIDFTVRVENGGLVETFRGHFADGAQGSSIAVTSFTH